VPLSRSPGPLGATGSASGVPPCAWTSCLGRKSSSPSTAKAGCGSRPCRVRPGEQESQSEQVYCIQKRHAGGTMTHRFNTLVLWLLALFSCRSSGDDGSEVWEHTSVLSFEFSPGKQFYGLFVCLPACLSTGGRRRVVERDFRRIHGRQSERYRVSRSSSTQHPFYDCAYVV